MKQRQKLELLDQVDVESGGLKLAKDLGMWHPKNIINTDKGCCVLPKLPKSYIQIYRLAQGLQKSQI